MRASLTARGIGRADDGADAREAALADDVLPELGDELRDVLPDLVAVRQHQVLNIGAPGFDVFTRQKSPPPNRRHEAANGSSESRPRYVYTVMGVGERADAVPRLEIRRGVRARRVADIAPLLSRITSETGGLRVVADLLERAHAVRAERLEARGLRLDRDDIRADGVDQAAAEAGERIGGRRPVHVGSPRELERQQLEAWVEADDELAPLL